MDTSKFGAPVQCRKDLARIQQAIRIEGAFEALLLLEVILVEHRTHKVTLLNSNAVLARQNAADLDAKLEDFAPELFCLLQFTGVVGIIEDQRMQISIACMKDVGDTEAVMLGHLVHALQDMW